MYNVPHGKRNRGMALVQSYRQLVPDASAEQLEQARILGWCVELLQTFFLISDDIMDTSITRRGQLCWYKQVIITINDINHKQKQKLSDSTFCALFIHPLSRSPHVCSSSFGKT